jgi:hypothetical protein
LKTGRSGADMTGVEVTDRRAATGSMPVALGV